MGDGHEARQVLGRARSQDHAGCVEAAPLAQVGKLLLDLDQRNARAMARNRSRMAGLSLTAARASIIPVALPFAIGR